MNTRLIIAILIGSIVSFLLGWVVFGMLMEPYYDTNMIKYKGLYRDEATMRLWGIYLAQLAWCTLLGFVLNMRPTKLNIGSAFVTGTLVMGLAMLGINLMMWSSMNLATYQVYIVDTLTNAVYGGIVAVVIALILRPKATA
ncbi:MAG: hypothetical protein SGI87_02400 [Flavobacteriales bacterium]|nr:hypothetical protein [Flavobacteriales bacterium]